jgi:hypothetical protein
VHASRYDVSLCCVLAQVRERRPCVRYDLFAGPKHVSKSPDSISRRNPQILHLLAHFSILIPIVASSCFDQSRLSTNVSFMFHAFHVLAIAPLTIGMHFRPRTLYTLLISLRTAVQEPCRAS